MAYPATQPAALTTGTVISKTTFGDPVLAALNFLANPPACRVYHSTTQSIAHNTVTVLTHNTERFDTDTMHDTVTNNSRITIKTAGIYVVTCNIEWQAAGDYTELLFQLNLNGTTIIASVRDRNPGATADVRDQLITTTYKFAVNDYVEARVRQQNGSAAARNLSNVPNAFNEFSAVWVGNG